MNAINSNDTKRLQVLLVEDDAVVQMVHKMLLTQLGCQVDIASNGTEALEKARGKYNIIFMDVGIPNQNGIEVTKIIRTYERNVPIIFLTAYGEKVKEDCLAAGGNDVFAKPIDQAKLAEILQRYCPNLILKEVTV